MRGGRSVDRGRSREDGPHTRADLAAGFDGWETPTRADPRRLARIRDCGDLRPIPPSRLPCLLPCKVGSAHPNQPQHRTRASRPRHRPGPSPNLRNQIDHPAEPARAQGGSYQVIRLIRMLVEFWDRVSINEQEGIAAAAATPAPRWTATMSSTLRTKPPMPTATSSQWMRTFGWPTRGRQRSITSGSSRRSYDYDLGVNTNGNLQAGHIFVAYQQDVHRQFETIQMRLIDEP